jgi:hypothetical protein
VTGITKAALDSEPGRYVYCCFLRPESGTGQPSTMYVESHEQPYAPGTVVELCPEWVTLTPSTV